MAGRTLREKLTDRLLLLYLIDDASKVGKIGKTKIQKLVFLSELSMFVDNLKGFNYNFIKLTYGAYSPEMDGDIPKLVETEIINDLSLLPTEKGKMILKDFSDLFEKNEIFLRKIKITNQKHAKMSRKELVNFVYNMRHPYMKGKPRAIRDLKLTTPLLKRISKAKASAVFEITDEEVEDLVMNFDPEIVKGLSEAMKEMRAGRLRTYEQSFTKL